MWEGERGRESEPGSIRHSQPWKWLWKRSIDETAVVCSALPQQPVCVSWYYALHFTVPSLSPTLFPFLSFLCRLVSSSHPGHPLGPVMVPLVLGTAHPSCRTSSFSRSSLATAWSSVVVAVAVVVDVENPQPTVQWAPSATSAKAT